MSDPIRRGIYGLPVAGVLTAIPWLFILGLWATGQGKIDPEVYARNLTSIGPALSGYVYLAGLICLLIGLLALYGYLARGSSSSWAAAGMILSVVGIAVALPAFGITRLADTALADVYLNGRKDVGAALGLLPDNTLTYRTTAYYALFMILTLLGAITFGVAVWRSARLPKWTGIVVAVGFALTMMQSPIVSWLGALGLVIGGIGLARVITRATGISTVGSVSSS